MAATGHVYFALLTVIAVQHGLDSVMTSCHFDGGCDGSFANGFAIHTHLCPVGRHVELDVSNALAFSGQLSLHARTLISGN